jgi:hypothetical protein
LYVLLLTSSSSSPSFPIFSRATPIRRACRDAAAKLLRAWCACASLHTERPAGEKEQREACVCVYIQRDSDSHAAWLRQPARAIGRIGAGVAVGKEKRWE